MAQSLFRTVVLVMLTIQMIHLAVRCMSTALQTDDGDPVPSWRPASTAAPTRCRRPSWILLALMRSPVPLVRDDPPLVSPGSWEASLLVASCVH